MNAQDYWQIFLDTGAPEMYLMYNQARKMEINHVPDSQGIGAAGDSLQ